MIGSFARGKYRQRGGLRFRRRTERSTTARSFLHHSAQQGLALRTLGVHQVDAGRQHAEVEGDAA
jgi:hypothetical protein